MKRILSGLIISSILVSGVPAYAANISAQFELGNDSKITQTYGVSFDQTISNINNTIKAINDMKAKGQVSDAQIMELASQIYSLEKATMGITLSDKELSDIANVLNSAESAIDGLDNVQSVEIAIMLSRQFYGLTGGKDLVEEFNRENNFGTKKEENSNPSPMAQPYGVIAVHGTEVVEDYTTDNNYAAGSTSGQLTGTQLVNSFWDVKPTDWYYTQVQAMVQRGLFAGKGPIDNGVGTFAPNDTMTKAEFITVVTRALYSDQLAGMPAVSGEFWYANNYDVAINNGLISESEFAFDKTTLNAPMPREEMALILVRACEQNGEYTGNTVHSSRISDIHTVSAPYQDAVIKAFSLGLIAGKDTSGRFAPQDTLTRAEGATVLYRLVNESKRVDVTPNDIHNNQGNVVENSTITINEWKMGDKARSNRNAKEGDIFIKANGEKVVLKKDQYGILGGGQGVAPDVGLMMNGAFVSPKGVSNFTYDAKTFGTMIDSTGMSIQNTGYYINKTTGEGHWASEWNKLIENIPTPDRDGSYEGEVSSDSYKLWVWRYGNWSMNVTKG